MFSNYFDVLMLKIIFKKLKNIINIHFNIKNYLKNNHNYTTKQAFNTLLLTFFMRLHQIKVQGEVCPNGHLLQDIIIIIII